jgi:hypothetical protein
MSFCLRRNNWRQNAASLLVWLHHILSEKKCIYQMLRRVWLIRPVRNRIIQTTLMFQQQMKLHAEQQAIYIVRHLVSRRRSGDSTYPSTEDNSLVLLATDKLPFFQVLQLVCDGVVDKSTGKKVYQNPYKRRYSRGLVCMLLLLMSLNMFSVVIGSVLFLWYLHTPAGDSTVVAHLSSSSQPNRNASLAINVTESSSVIRFIS